MAYLSFRLHDHVPAATARRGQAGTGSDLLGRALAMIRLWRERVRERETLARLSEIELRDLRFSRSEIAEELRKPFWRG